MDRIFVLSNGRIAESGDYDTLLQHGCKLAELTKYGGMTGECVRSTSTRKQLACLEVLLTVQYYSKSNFSNEVM